MSRRAPPERRLVRELAAFSVLSMVDPRHVALVRSGSVTRTKRTGLAVAAVQSKPGVVRHDWSLAEARSSTICRCSSCSTKHARFTAAPHRLRVQLCTLLSVKTVVPEIARIPQSSPLRDRVGAENMLNEGRVSVLRPRAKDAATRFCMGAAWREIKDGPAFDRVLGMVRGVKGLGLELLHAGHGPHRTAGSRLKEAARRLQPQPRHLARRLQIDHQHAHVRRPPAHAAQRCGAGITICSGGIIGMGESIDDRCQMLVELAKMDPQPESVPINALVRVAGTPLESLPPVDPIEFIRMIATARMMMPRAMVRLSAGRSELTREAQLLAMYAGANSIFYGTSCYDAEPETDGRGLLRAAGVQAMQPVSNKRPSRTGSCCRWGADRAATTAALVEPSPSVGSAQASRGRSSAWGTAASLAGGYIAQMPARRRARGCQRERARG